MTEPICGEHLAAVAELEASCFSEPWSRDALSLLLTEQASGVVLMQNGAVVAYGGVLWAPDEGQITNIAVSPDFRRRGFGEQILQALILLAKEKGALQLVLEVRASNEAAITLYEKSGFLMVGRRKAFYRAPREDALVMVLSL